jgi:hypothetical protein
MATLAYRYIASLLQIKIAHHVERGVHQSTELVEDRDSHGRHEMEGRP